MKYIDFKKDLSQYLTDDSRKISKEHLENVCKIYHKHDTCRYIFLSPIGHICMKNTSAKKEIDRLVKNKTMTSWGDNCGGIGKFEKK